ncbi:MAG: CocE/NonD family hydrolase [Pseudomonadota bacterium]|nr:CocE/NonD family hydrolase [Pseudomonadota bacterium]
MIADKSIVELPSVQIEMRDGCFLSARIWMPASASSKPVPAILEHLPYRKRDGTAHRDTLNHTWFAAHGYACIRTDMRGNGDSQGLMHDEYLQQELDDAVDVIEWLAKQKWCSGNVGMMGISWGGFNSLQVASMSPENLKAVITVCSSADRFADDIHYKGGCLLTNNFTWAARMLSYSSRPPDPLTFGGNWKKEWLLRLNHLPLLADKWLSEQSRGKYWKHGSICEDYPMIKTPVLAFGGWHDGYRNTVSKLVSNLLSPVKGIIGPWNHRYPHLAEPEPKIGFLQESLRWWNRWLLDEQNGVEKESDLRVFLMDSVYPNRQLKSRAGRWISGRKKSQESSMPIMLNFGEKTLGTFEKISTPRRFCSKMDCGMQAGEFFPYNFGPEMPGDQNADDKKSLYFDGATLEKDIIIQGCPKVSMVLASDKPLGQVAVRLCDLRPDGSSALISHGFLNLTMHKSFEKPQLLKSGKKINVFLDLDDIAYRVPAGHKLRLSISNCYWPFIWPSPEIVTMELFSGNLTIPQMDLKTHAESISFEAPVSGASWNVEVIRGASSRRREFIDFDTNESVVEVRNDSGHTRDLSHGLEADSSVLEEWRILKGDPLSASVAIEWKQELARGDWKISTLAKLKVSCCQEKFYLKGVVTASEGFKQFFSKKFKTSVKRKFI